MRSIVFCSVLAVAVIVLSSTTSSAFSIVRFDGQASTPQGAPVTQAGAHADVSMDLQTSTTTDADGMPVPDGTVRDISVNLPVGLLGDPTTTPKCTAEQLGAGFAGTCPDSTQVGVATVHTSSSGDFPVAIYNLVPPPNMPAQFGFNLYQNVVHLNARLRGRGDGYGLAIDIDNIAQALPVIGAQVTLWGVPADPSHDAMRGSLLAGGLCNDGGSMPCPAHAPRTPFITLPSDCAAGPLTSTVSTYSWQNPSDVQTGAFVSHLPDGTPAGADRCEKLRFEPSIEVQPDRAAAGKPSGLLVRIRVPQDDNPDGLAVPPLRKAVVTLPKGVVVSPSGARGLQACAPSQIELDDVTEPTCPAASNLGHIVIDTPLLADPLQGSIYLAKQTDNPFGTTLALYLVARGPGVVLKLPGKVEPDPVTGQVVTTFDNNPQLPFSQFDLRFDGGDTAALSMPVDCGPKTTTAELTPWSSSAPVVVSDTFHVSADGSGAPCGNRGFSPSFNAGTTSLAAGGDATFSLTFSRDDAEQELSDIAIDMPPGLLGRIASVPLCPDALAATGACDGSSQIGSVTTAAGPGDQPYYLPGKAFITGAYKGAPFGLSIVVPAVAGPFDLGTVVVRAALSVDRSTAALHVQSDSMPTILQGIPLQVRTVSINIDRPGFMFNPSNCSSMRVSGSIASTSGTVRNVDNHFQVAGCAALPFSPRMTLRAGSRGHTKKGVTTPLSVTLSMTNGQANNRVVDVDLPRTLNAELNVVNVRNSCSPAQYQADACPVQVGTATAITPLLRDPLVGRIFLVRNGRSLPDMMVRLRGQGDASLVDIDLAGKITIPKDLTVRTTFDAVPDVPITSFRLDLVSGRNAPVGTVRNLCDASVRKASVAKLAFTAQSGKKVTRNQTVTVAGCGKAASHRRAARKHKRSGKKSHRATKKGSRKAAKKHARS
jgi:hypothetical protein